MKKVKRPRWDKQEQDKRILFDPDSLRRKDTLEQTPEVGMHAWGSVRGVQIAIQLVDILPSTAAEGVITRIENKAETVDGLVIGDHVFIKRSDMNRLDIN